MKVLSGLKAVGQGNEVANASAKNKKVPDGMLIIQFSPEVKDGTCCIKSPSGPYPGKNWSGHIGPKQVADK